MAWDETIKQRLLSNISGVLFCFCTSICVFFFLLSYWYSCGSVTIWLNYNTIFVIIVIII